MKVSSLELADWLFGASGKRRLLVRLLAHDAPGSWSQAQLARAAGLHAKGSVDVHLAALCQLRLLCRRGGVYRLRERSPLLEPLRSLLAELERLPAVPVKKPPA